jgi:anti-sigma regulatory factor (Ser/Thr protein kinase)
MPSCSFPPEPTSPALARGFLQEILGERGMSGWPASLLLSELVSNVVEHARTEFTVRIDVTDRLRVEVADGSAVMPALQEAAIDAERGRGLHLLDRMAGSWGVDSGPEGKTIWFEVAAEAGGSK